MSFLTRRVRCLVQGHLWGRLNPKTGRVPCERCGRVEHVGLNA